MSDKRRNKKRGITRRDFIKWSAAAGAAAKAVDWASVGPAYADYSDDYVIRNICPYCSVSCGVKTAVQDTGNSVNTTGAMDGDETILDIYGDEGNVLNRGSLCSKGSALYQLVDPNGSIGARVTEPRIKHNGSWHKHSSGAAAGWLDIFGLSGWSSSSYANTLDLAAWQVISPSPAASGTGTIPTLPRQMELSRGTGHTGVSPSKVAFWGSSHLTNEECYLYRKLITLFGTNNIEHQARI